MFVYIIIAIIIIKIVYEILYAKIKGQVGEKTVKNKLKKLPSEYLSLNDIIIEQNGITHQIDHIVLSKYGIFVIETKNYSNLITGNSKSAEWTQHIWTNKYKFRNPIFQNYGHIKALEESLGLDYKKFISVICFPNKTMLHIKNADNVIKLKQLIPYIESFEKTIVYEDIEVIYDAIKKLDVTDKKIRNSHVKNVKNKLKDEEKLVEQRICPRCGSQLVARKGKYGMFLGCSNYPKCKYVKNV